MMKKTRIYRAKGMTAGEGCGDVKTMRCEGLCPSVGIAGLEASGGLAEVNAARGLKPLCEFRTDSGETGVLFSKGRLLFTGAGELRADMEVSAAPGAELPGEAVCAAGGEGEATVMCEDAETGSYEAVRLIFRGYAVRVVPDPSSYPSAELKAVPAGSYSASAGPRKTDYSPLAPSTLRRETAGALAADLTDAYLRCVEGSLAAGAYIQPALVAYRYLDDRGRVLYESRPVLLGRDNNCKSALTGFVDRSVSAEGEASAFSLSADGWRPELSLPAGFAAAAPEVAAVEILAGEQFHPYHPDGRAEAVGVSRGNFRGVSVALPGHYLGLSEASEDAVGRARLAAACGAFGFMAHVAGRLIPEANGARQELTGRFSPGDMSAAGSVRRLEAAVEAAAKDDSNAGRLWARTCARDAGRLLWGNLRRLRPRGVAPGSIATVRGTDLAAAWRASVSVGFGQGPERVVAECSGMGRCPTHLSPILSYGDPEAREMRVQVVCGGKLYDRRFALAPDPTGRMACYVSPGFEPIDVRSETAGIFETESGYAPGKAEATGLASADAENPTECLCRGCCAGAVVSIVVAETGNQAWEYGRHRFAATTTAGLAAITTGGSTMSVREVWHGGVEALASGGGEGVFALSGGLLLRMGPTGRVKTIATPCAGRFLGYSGERGLLTGGDWTLDTGSGEFYRDKVHASASGAGSVGGRCYILTGSDGRLMLPAASIAAENADVDYEFVADALSCGHRPRRMRLDMAGEHVMVSIYITEDATGGGTGVPLGLWTVNGRLSGPLTLRLSPRRTTQGRMRVRIQGRVSGDFVLRTISMDYDC